MYTAAREEDEVVVGEIELGSSGEVTRRCVPPIDTTNLGWLRSENVQLNLTRADGVRYIREVEMQPISGGSPGILFFAGLFILSFPVISIYTSGLCYVDRPCQRALFASR